MRSEGWSDVSVIGITVKPFISMESKKRKEKRAKDKRAKEQKAKSKCKNKKRKQKARKIDY